MPMRNERRSPATRPPPPCVVRTPATPPAMRRRIWPATVGATAVGMVLLLGPAGSARAASGQRDAASFVRPESAQASHRDGTVFARSRTKDADGEGTPRRRGRGRSRTECSGGMVAAGDHCCWPGQDWGASASACIGMPQCPDGTVSSGSQCVPGCPTGQVLVAGHCCWPGQDWGTSTDRCIGTPRCPDGTLPADDQCVPGCRGGRFLTQGHCCWPGQEWSASAGSCVGAPTCPDGTIASRDACVPGCPDGRMLVSGSHCCWPGQSWDDDAVACVGTPDCPVGHRVGGSGTDCEPLPPWTGSANVGVGFGGGFALHGPGQMECPVAIAAYCSNTGASGPFTPCVLRPGEDVLWQIPSAPQGSQYARVQQGGSEYLVWEYSSLTDWNYGNHNTFFYIATDVRCRFREGGSSRDVVLSSRFEVQSGGGNAWAAREIEWNPTR